MSVIGTSPPRPDGYRKVVGATRYADDLALPGMLFGATLRSPHPRARIEALRWRPEAAPPGAVCVTAADLPGPNGVQLINDDWPVLAAGEVHHVGQAVALVAAASPEDARRALRAVEVDYATLPAVLDLEEAAAHPALSTLSLAEGDVESALAAAPIVVEGCYRTGHQEHIYIEPQAMTAWTDEEGVLVVDGSMQCPYYVHKALLHALELDAERVRVRASAVGGGFGGKEDYPSLIALHAALLCRAAGKAVRLLYDRHEDIVGTTKRHPSVVHHRTGVNQDGHLLAMDVDVVLDGGAFTTLSPVVLSRAVLHAAGPYRCPAVRVRGRALATHTAPNGAFRGFGAPQTLFAVERQMDRIARRVGLDPYEVRRRNALRPGDRLPTGQVLDDSTAALPCLEKAERETDFSRRWRELEARRSASPEEETRRGIGLALYFHGTGFTGTGEHKMRSPVDVRLAADGRLEVLSSMTEMGQGSQSIFQQIACEVSGLTPYDLDFPEPDTAVVPDSGPTVASRATVVVGSAMARAVEQARDRVLAWWREEQGLEGPPHTEDGEVVAADGDRTPFREVARRCHAALGGFTTTARYDPPGWQQFDEERYRGAAYPTYSWGADVVEVEVDPDTWETRAVAATAVCEVGRALHPTLCAGQVEGGTLQAIGWALLEEVKVEEGRYLNDRLATYIIPTFKDAPCIDVHLLEQPWEGGLFGAKGVGELPMDGGAPATAGAVENATGWVVETIPATPERLFAAAQKGQRVTQGDDGDGG